MKETVILPREPARDETVAAMRQMLALTKATLVDSWRGLQSLLRACADILLAGR
ncbi:MAG TPA: hypothetical protein VLC55_13500 [Burkholderiales bacterium]|nr:hypothetical protein [Burkholderiales bacterium]